MKIKRLYKIIIEIKVVGPYEVNSLKFNLKKKFLNHFDRLCRSLKECITNYDNGTLLHRPYQPVI